MALHWPPLPPSVQQQIQQAVATPKPGQALCQQHHPKPYSCYQSFAEMVSVPAPETLGSPHPCNLIQKLLFFQLVPPKSRGRSGGAESQVRGIHATETTLDEPRPLARSEPWESQVHRCHSGYQDLTPRSGEQNSGGPHSSWIFSWYVSNHRTQLTAPAGRQGSLEVSRRPLCRLSQQSLSSRGRSRVRSAEDYVRRKWGETAGAGIPRPQGRHDKASASPWRCIQGFPSEKSLPEQEQPGM